MIFKTDMTSIIKSNVQQKLDQTLKNFEEDLSSANVSQASTKLLDRVLVEAYGDRVRLDQVAHVSLIDKQTLKIQSWDAANLKNIEKGINLANLGVSISNEAGVIIIKLPTLTEERRKELTKVVNSFGERAKVAIKHIRRSGMDILKQAKKDGTSEDLIKKETGEIDKLIDEYNDKIDKLVEEKNIKIMTI